MTAGTISLSVGYNVVSFVLDTVAYQIDYQILSGAGSDWTPDSGKDGAQH